MTWFQFYNSKAVLWGSVDKKTDGLAVRWLKHRDLSKQIIVSRAFSFRSILRAVFFEHAIENFHIAG